MRLLACQTTIAATRNRLDQRAHLDALAERLRTAAAQQRPDLIVLPELSSQEYGEQAFEAMDELDDDLQGPVTAHYCALAQELACPIAFGVARRSRLADGSIQRHISQVVVDAEGRLAGAYDKLHCAQFGASAEAAHFSPGERLVTLDIAGWRVGFMICYDLRFSELAARYRQLGVDLMVHPVAFTRDFSFTSWHSFVITRAMENQCYWLSLNRAGSDWGHSLLCPPLVTSEASPEVLGEEQAFVCWQLERDTLERARKRLPLAGDRRQDIDRLPTGPLPSPTDTTASQ